MYHPFSITGQDYIQFLDLEENDGVLLESVAPDELGTNSSDYYSRPIFVNTGIPIGAREELTNTLYVCITMGY